MTSVIFTVEPSARRVCKGHSTFGTPYAFVLLVVCFLVSGGPRAAIADEKATLEAVLAAEAARGRTPAQIEVLRRASREGSSDVQRAAVRALGRLERPQLLPDLLPQLAAKKPVVRAEAANAVVQAAGQDPEAVKSARSGLLRRLPVEKDGEVRAAVCEALGRLPVDNVEEARAIERLLAEETARVEVGKDVRVTPAGPLLGVTIGWGRPRETSTPAAIGALRGLESLVRLRKKILTPAPETIAQLQALALDAVAPARRLALLVLNAAAAADAGTIDAGTIDRALGDEDVEVRRLAAASPSATLNHLQRGLADTSPSVRYEALRAYGRRLQAQEGCSPVVARVRDTNLHVVLLAIDLLGTPCRPGDGAEEALLDAAAAPSGWHIPAHAIVSLARISPARAAAMLGRFAAGEPWQLRMYAARAASELGNGDTLTTLSADTNLNVREAAVAGLSKVRKHAADEIYLRALDADDGQLAMTAAAALEGTPGKERAAAAVAAALRRWTAAGSDTSRDPRLALLDRLLEVGSRDSASAVAPLLRDFDPRVAERAALVMRGLTGGSAEAAPALRPPQAVPSAQDLKQLAGSIARVTMKGGGHFDVRLLTDVAPLSCAAFARLVTARYYDGLTFHRVLPNFLIQGGSPGANEFSGAARFWVDEVGRATQARGTVGTSTRGRDTGDGQFYINLVDTPRLDHEYTIFGQVVSGMDVVDGIVEGDVIERAQIVAK